MREPGGARAIMTGERKGILLFAEGASRENRRPSIGVYMASGRVKYVQRCPSWSNHNPGRAAVPGGAGGVPNGETQVGEQKERRGIGRYRENGDGRTVLKGGRRAAIASVCG